MKIVVNTNEKQAVQKYIGACYDLANKLAGEGSYELNEDMAGLDRVLLELGVQIGWDKEVIEIEIPEELTVLYMEMCTEYLGDITDDVINLVKLGKKYGPVVEKALEFLSVLDTFSAPVKEIKNAFKSFDKTSELSNQKLLIRVSGYIQTLKRG